MFVVKNGTNQSGDTSTTFTTTVVPRCPIELVGECGHEVKLPTDNQDIHSFTHVILG